MSGSSDTGRVSSNVSIVRNIILKPSRLKSKKLVLQDEADNFKSNDGRNDVENELFKKARAELKKEEAEPFRQNCQLLDSKEIVNWLTDPPVQWVTFGYLRKPEMGDVYLFDMSMLEKDLTFEEKEKGIQS